MNFIEALVESFGLETLRILRPCQVWCCGCWSKFSSRAVDLCGGPDGNYILEVEPVTAVKRGNKGRVAGINRNSKPWSCANHEMFEMGVSEVDQRAYIVQQDTNSRDVSARVVISICYLDRQCNLMLRFIHRLLRNWRPTVFMIFQGRVPVQRKSLNSLDSKDILNWIHYGLAISEFKRQLGPINWQNSRQRAIIGLRNEIVTP